MKTEIYPLAEGALCQSGEACYSREDGQASTKYVYATADMTPTHSDSENFYFGYAIFTRDVGPKMVEQKVNRASLENVGETSPISFFNRMDGSNSDFYFASGNKISLGQVTANSEISGYTLSMPKLRDLTADEITPNKNLASGEQTNDPSLKKSILSFTPGVETSLTIQENPNSILALLGLEGDVSKYKMSFPVDDISQVKTYATNSDEYSLEQLLNGEFTPQTTSIARKLADGNTTLDDENYYYTSYANDNDYASEYYYGTDDFSNPINSATTAQAQQYTILNLPQNQTIILVGVNATTMLQERQSYFLLESEITNSPTSEPSSQPSEFPTSQPTTQPNATPSLNPTKIPTSNPTTQPSSHPTHHPIAGDLISPTSQPTKNPTAIPTEKSSSHPSLRQYSPSEIPSSNPSSNPSSAAPSSTPSQILTSQDDSAIPTIKSEFNPSSNPTSNPTSKPSAAEILTNIPTPEIAPQSNQPITFQPSSLPTFIDPLTNQPTSNSTAITSTFNNTTSDNSRPSNSVVPIAVGVSGGIALALVGAAVAVRKFLWRSGNVAPTRGQEYHEEDSHVAALEEERTKPENLGGNGR